MKRNISIVGLLFMSMSAIIGSGWLFATSYADTLSKCMNYYQACKIKEAKMIEDLKNLQEIRRELKLHILKGI